MVFQSYALFPHMTRARERALRARRVRAARSPTRTTRARDALATVGLTGFDERLPSELSGGQQQRVAVARALVLEPAVLLFDEPLSNLDARLRRQMREEIRDLQQRLGLTVVYVTHDQSEALAVSDRIVVMNQRGRSRRRARRASSTSSRATPFVAGFMGDANRVRGVLARRDARHGRRAPRPGDAARCRIAASPTARSTSRSVPKRSSSSRRAERRSAGTVRKAAYLGGMIEYTLDTDVGELFAISLAVDRPRAVGIGGRRGARRARRGGHSRGSDPGLIGV